MEVVLLQLPCRGSFLGDRAQLGGRWILTHRPEGDRALEVVLLQLPCPRLTAGGSVRFNAQLAAHAVAGAAASAEAARPQPRRRHRPRPRRSLLVRAAARLPVASSRPARSLRHPTPCQRLAVARADSGCCRASGTRSTACETPRATRPLGDQAGLHRGKARSALGCGERVAAGESAAVVSNG
eukprot:365647-Chlamydomonas_euryale.AAC.4